MKIKTKEGWDAFAEETGNGDIDAYLQPGDLVDAWMNDDFLNILPPRHWDHTYLQGSGACGIAFNPKSGKHEETYISFMHVGPKLYRYLGKCFDGQLRDAGIYQVDTVAEFLQKTFRVNPLTQVQEIRPYIICEDGFTISVQAGSVLDCTPRENVEAYEDVQCDHPSEVEEVLLRYAKEEDDPKETKYPYVPIDVVEAVVKKHGGFRKGGKI